VFGSTDMTFFKWVMRTGIGQSIMTCLSNGLNGKCRFPRLFGWVRSGFKGITCLTKRVVFGLPFNELVVGQELDLPTFVASLALLKPPNLYSICI
jgi:hypothetical protein